MIFGAALFGRADRRWTTAAAIAGGLLPDLSLYLLAGGSIFLMGIPPETVFGQMYFSPGWQAVFAVDNSIPLWGLLLLLALLMRSAPAIALGASGLLHVVIDFLVHHDDARRHLWPLSDYVFVSPVSYWDPAHYGLIFAPLEVVVCLVLSVVLWRRFPGRVARALIVLAMMAQASPALIFGLMFAGS
jgi:hypothetical protein